MLAAAAADALGAQRPVMPWLIMIGTLQLPLSSNPYHVGIYAVVRQLMSQTELWTRIGAANGAGFWRQDPLDRARDGGPTAAGSLGWQLREWRRASALRQPFCSCSDCLCWAPTSGSKSRRDTWLTVTAAACAIAAAPWDTVFPKPPPPPPPPPPPRLEARFPGWLAASAASAMAALLAFVAPADAVGRETGGRRGAHLPGECRGVHRTARAHGAAL